MSNELLQAVIEGERESEAELAKQALEQGADPLSCINQGLTKGIRKVGELLNDGEYFLPWLITGAGWMGRW